MAHSEVRYGDWNHLNKYRVCYIDELDPNTERNVITTNTSDPVKFYEDPRTWYLNFIIGIKAQSDSSIIEISTSAFSKSENTYTVEIVSDSQTKL